MQYGISKSALSLIALLFGAGLLCIVYFLSLFFEYFPWLRQPVVFEATVITLLATSLYWYKSSDSKKKTTTVLPVIKLILSTLAISYFIILILFIKDSSIYVERAHTLQTKMDAQSELYLPLLTTVFDKAETVNVRKDIDEQFNTLLSNSSIPENGREPSYFIRLKGNNLQKLFQSGELKEDFVDTAGERTVMAMLLGKKVPVMFPQYSCCGPDDIFPDVPFLRLILPERRYLKDFPSEFETILLIKDNNNNILGAKVILYGD